MLDANFSYKGKPFEGFFFVTKNHSEIIRVSFPKTVHPYSVGADPMLLFKPSNHYWVGFYSGKPNDYIQFEFLQEPIILTHYSIGSYSGGDANLEKWRIEGADSENAEQWTVLHNQEESTDSRFQHKAVTFECSNPGKFRFLRLVHVKNYSNTHGIHLANIEFFGKFSSS